MWHTKKLNEVCDIQSGLWKGKKEPYTTALVLRNTNFTASGVFDYSNVVELEVETKQLANREVIKNDIILEKSGGGDKTPVGRVCIHDKESKIPFSLSNFTARIRVLDSKELNAEFLHKFLYFLYISGKTEPMQRHSTGIRNLQLNQYKNIDIPVPPLAEQERIVAKLDAAFAEIDEAVEIAQDRKALLEVFQASVINNAFELLDNEIHMGEIFKFVRGPFGGSLKKNIFVEEGFAVYEQQHAIKNQCNDFRYFISQEKFNEMARFKVTPNSILMSCSGTIGKTTIAPESPTAGIINQALLMIQPNESVLPRFTKLFMESVRFSEQLMDTVDGAAQKNVASVKVLKQISMPVPHIKVQQEIVSRVTQIIRSIEGLKKIKEDTIKNYLMLKSSILKQELQSSEAA
jgi:type I restriction enzyme, S subunit